MGTREIIIETAKDLFNEHGAANVGTNRIAAFLKISPGNLYYHFKNKEEIIRSIFPQINRATEQALMIQGDNIPPEARLVRILENWMAVVWEYRFFYGNLVQLLRNDPELQAQYIERRKMTLKFLKAAFRATASTREDRKPKLTDTEVEMLATNVWIIALNWIHFLQIDKTDEEISREDVFSGADQIFSVLSPYLDGETRASMAQELKNSRKARAR